MRTLLGFHPLLSLLLALFLAGCGAERAEHDSDEQPEERGAELFVKNKGVLLPPEMQRELGVATAEVTERKMLRRVETAARVYRAASEHSPAAAMAWLTEAESKEWQPGMSITLKPLSGSHGDVAGKLISLQTAPSSPAEVEALIEFTDAERRFPNGSTLKAVFATGKEHTALAVPEGAVTHGAGGAFVYAANGGHFTRTSVKTGAVADGWTEITEGLYAGDVVVSKSAGALWLIELCALKGGSPCCPVPTKKRDN